MKSAASLVVDTLSPNGHSVSADALWAGVPIVTLAGEDLSDRLSSSLIHASSYSVSITITRTLLEYEATASQLSVGVRARGISSMLRSHIASAREDARSGLFDTASWTAQFVRQLRGASEVRLSGKSPMHVFPPAGDADEHIARGLPNIPTLARWLAMRGLDGCSVASLPLLLHIGGHCRKKGWTVVDALPRAETDAIADASKLLGLPQASTTILYASHVLEHLDYNRR